MRNIFINISSTREYLNVSRGKKKEEKKKTNKRMDIQRFLVDFANLVVFAGGVGGITSSSSSSTLDATAVLE
jgi:hypothetical protein